jgi:hypothetical protein
MVSLPPSLAEPKNTLGSPGWPPLIVDWQGVPDMPPFESYRGELLPLRDAAA